MCKHVVVSTQTIVLVLYIAMKEVIPESQQLHMQSESELLNLMKSRQTIDGSTILEDKHLHKLSEYK